MSKTYFIITTQRSGHHAFINSILTNNSDPCYFINNPAGKKPKPGVYPEKYLNRKINYRFQFNDGAKKILVSEGLNDISEVGESIYSIPQALQRKKFRSIFKQNSNSKLIINHEGGYLRIPKIIAYNSSVNKFIGASESYNINFFRDPLNLFASILTRSCLYENQNNMPVSIYSQDNSTHVARIKKLTQKMSRYFDYFTSVSSQPLTIDYVTWMNNYAYQRNLQERLNLTINGPSNHSTIHGGGSSFKQKSGNYTSYSSRFEQFFDTEPFESLVDQFKNEIINYYNIFGRDYYPNLHQLVR